jgi:hypothetical protein
MEGKRPFHHHLEGFMNVRGIFVGVVALLALSGCAAFDTDNTPYAGFDQVQLPPSVGGGPYAGYYAGTMTLESNACEAVSDAVGDAVPIAFTITENENLLNIVMPDKSASSAELDDAKKGKFVIQTGSVKHVYTVDLSKEQKVSGACDVIEADANGMYGTSCASYVLDLTRGEKPAAE